MTPILTAFHDEYEHLFLESVNVQIFQSEGRKPQKTLRSTSYHSISYRIVEHMMSHHIVRVSYRIIPGHSGQIRSDQVISDHIKSHQIMSCHVMSDHTISHPVISYCFKSIYYALYNASWQYPISSYIILKYRMNTSKLCSPKPQTGPERLR